MARFCLHCGHPVEPTVSLRGPASGAPEPPRAPPRANDGDPIAHEDPVGPTDQAPVDDEAAVGPTGVRVRGAPEASSVHTKWRSAPSLPPRYIPEGTRVGVYEIVSVLGEGGMGVVYRAWDDALGREVAIKALHPNLFGDPEIRRRFIREAKVMRSFHHEHVVSVFDFVEDPELLAIVMELVEGQTLEDFLAAWGGPLPESDAQLIFGAVLSAMEAAHARGIVHRDLKPQNILLRPTEAGLAPKVADFGIAKVIEGTQFTMTGAVLGTAHYMAPEQVQAPQAVDARTDVYALAVTLYRALTGRLPFESDSQFAVMMSHVTQPPPPPRRYRPNLAPELEALLLEALSKDPKARPATCGEFRERLEQTLGAAPAAVVRAARPPIVEDTKGHRMLLVDAGRFQMGPSRRDVWLDAYYVDEVPVTNRWFQTFLDATGYWPEDEEAHRFVSHWRSRTCPQRLLDHPVVFVSWHDAQAFCAWAGRRLPSEAEWEKAARGEDGRKYPWGREEPTTDHANFGRSGTGTTPVKACPAGRAPCGALDMAGNVWEWCEDIDEPEFYLRGPTRNPRHTASAGDAPCVVRGGSWMYDARSLRTFARSSFHPSYRLDGVGFRTVRSPWP